MSNIREMEPYHSQRELPRVCLTLFHAKIIDEAQTKTQERKGIKNEIQKTDVVWDYQLNNLLKFTELYLCLCKGQR